MTALPGFGLDDIVAIIKPHNDKLAAEARVAVLERENAALRQDIAMRPHELALLYSIREALGFNKYYGLSNLDADCRALVRRKDRLGEMLERCEEYFDNRSDVKDGSYGVPEPNTEMQMLSDIRETLGSRP